MATSRRPRPLAPKDQDPGIPPEDAPSVPTLAAQPAPQTVQVTIKAYYDLLIDRRDALQAQADACSAQLDTLLMIITNGHGDSILTLPVQESVAAP